MTAKTRASLESFVTACNWVIPHPLDYRRFDRFVVTAFRNGDRALSLEDFKEIVPERYVDHWAKRYETGIGLLNVAEQNRAP